MRIAICDDNPRDIRFAQECCLALDPAASIQAFSNGITLHKEIKGGFKPNIILLDVDMPGDNGIEIGKKIRELDKKVIIIFCTSYPQYAVESYECEAFHYLLKPTSKEKFLATMEKAYAKITIEDKSIVIKQNNLPRQLFLRDIYFIECIGRHIVYHLKEEDIKVFGKISDALGEVVDFCFCQVHQGYIVNIKKIVKFEGLNIVLQDGKIVPMSVRKKKAVLVRYAKYVGDNL